MIIGQSITRVGQVAPPPAPDPELPPGEVVYTRTYGDEVMVKLMGLTTYPMVIDGVTYEGISSPSNFQNIALWTKARGFGAVDQFQRLGKAQLDYLRAIQPQDGGEQKRMAFLVGFRHNAPPARPYWTRNTTWDAWLAGVTRFEFGTIVFGGQPVLVEAAQGVKREYQFEGQYQQTNRRELITFYKVIGLGWADRQRYNPQKHPWWFQTTTWADRNNTYYDRWHGYQIFHPVWSAEDFATNYHDRELFLAKAFCIP